MDLRQSDFACASRWPSLQVAARTITLAAALAMATDSHAQWSITQLGPPAGYTYAVGNAMNPTNQYGFLDQFSGGNEFSYAAAWSYTAASYVSMNPTGATLSKIFSAGGNQEVGQVEMGAFYDAALWTGTAASFVNLGTGGFATAEADGTDGTNQVGTGYINGNPIALMWSGTAGSVVDLDPDGSTGYSQAFAVTGNIQGGFCVDTGTSNTVIWHGTAASMTSIAPASSTSSVVNVLYQGEAGGNATFGGGSQAGIWTNDTAGSWISLAPAGTTSSNINGIDGNYQIGTVIGASGTDNAGLWIGSAASFIDLNQFLPAGYNQYSEANSIYIDPSGGIWVLGDAGNFTNGVAGAFLWHLEATPEPCSIAALGLGVVALVRRRAKRAE